MASTYRIHCYAKGLKELGVQVEVVSTKAVARYFGRSFLSRGQRDQIGYTILLNKGAFKCRLTSYLWAETGPYVLVAYCVLAARKFDVLWLYGMGLIPRLILIPVMRLLGKKVVLELNEYPYSTEGSKFTRIPIVQKTMRLLTLRCVFPQLDGFVVISEYLAKTVSQHAITARVLKVPILVEPARSPAWSSDFRDDSRSCNRYMFHAGSLTIQKDGILEVVQAFAKAAHRLNEFSFRLNLVLTNKTALPEVWNAITGVLVDNGLYDRIEITGYLDEEELHRYLRHASVLLINKPASFQNKYNFPTKLGDYLLSGTPVIIGAEDTELNVFLTDNENSRIVPPNNVSRIADAIVEICLDNKLANRLGASGRETALNYFDYRRNAFRIKDFLDSL